METSLLIFAILNFIYVCLLPFVFFRSDGKFNLMWCLTASPYVVYPVLLVMGKMGMINSLITSQEVLSILQYSTIPLYVLSFIVMSLTLGTHRIPLSLWHQNNDAPKSIITFGAYAKFRHPFYTSFILCLTAGAMTFPHPLTFAVTLSAISLLTFTAIKEEGKLSKSEFGQEYQEYMMKTGRFFPRLF